jgi:hypothetical protein
MKKEVDERERERERERQRLEGIVKERGRKGNRGDHQEKKIAGRKGK